MTLIHRTKTTAELLRVAVYGADTPQGHELASLLRLHPGVGSADEVACDGSTLIGWDATAEPCWSSETPARSPSSFDVAFVCLPSGLAPRVRAEAAEAGAQVIGLAPEAEVIELDSLAQADDVVTPSEAVTSAPLSLAQAEPESELEMHVAIGLSRLATGEVEIAEGASGPVAVRSVRQAIKTMNRLCSLEETSGLPVSGCPGQEATGDNA